MSTEAYRYEDRRYASMDEDAPLGPLLVQLFTYEVLKDTPKGFVIDPFGCGGRRFVLGGAKKKFACKTKAEALESFKARKRRQASIYRARLNDAQEALRLAEDMKP